MAVKVRIPGSLKKWFNGHETVFCKGSTLAECINHLDEMFAGIRDQIIDKHNEISSVLIFLNGDNIRTLDGLSTLISTDDEISIIPLAAGG